MSLSKVLKIVKEEATISSLIPITHLNSPSVFESKAGLLGSVIHVNGISFEVEEPNHLNHQGYLLHQAILGLDERFMVYVTQHRKKQPRVVAGEFKSAFARSLNERYMARFTNKNLYVNDLYITVVLKGDTSNQTATMLNWAKRMANIGSNSQHSLFRKENMAVLHHAILQLKANLSSFKPTILGEADEALGYSELMHFLSLVPNAGYALPFRTPLFCPPIAKDIPDAFKAEIQYPEGNLSQYLSRYQLLFGEYIQFQGNSNQDKRFATILSLKTYPTKDTFSLMLDVLLSLDSEYIATHTFAPIERTAALKEIDKRRNKFINAEDKAGSQIAALKELEDSIACGTERLGSHHNTLMLIAADKKQLEAAILEATKRYSHVGIVTVKETLGIESAFWGQIPCNQHHITRASLITSRNFTDFCALHNTQTGFECDNHLNGAVTLLETPSKTPVFFNYHARGSKTNPAKGHTAIFGGNNAGKTTLVTFLDAQMSRFNGRSFFIDRDESAKIYILATGNSSYIKIAPNNPIAMNPLLLPDTPSNRAFLKSWLQALVYKESELSLPSAIAETLNECIDYAYEQLSPDYRTLSHISEMLPVDFPRWPELRRWLKGRDKADGEFHWIFDNKDDAVKLDFDRVGFDVTYLMDKTPHLIATPVYMYLVHRMHECLDGRLTSFVIEEAWQVFASPYWEKKLREDLATIRKKNGHFIFNTQSPKTVTTSAIRHVVLDNLATMILFPNPMADRETYIEHLKLTESEYLAIKENTPESRLFLYKQEHEAILCKLDLSDMSDVIRVLSGNTKSVQLLDSLIRDMGDDPALWLPAFIERSDR